MSEHAQPTLRVVRPGSRVFWRMRVCRTFSQDYPIPGLRNLTAKVVFTRGDQVEYYGTTFLGCAHLPPRGVVERLVAQ